MNSPDFSTWAKRSLELKAETETEAEDKEKTKNNLT